MNGLNKRPGFQRSSHGLEWGLRQRLPAMLAWGTALPLLGAGLRWLMAPDQPGTNLDDASRGLLVGQSPDLVCWHGRLLLTPAIGCGIGMLIQGPADVADACPPPARHPRAIFGPEG